MFGPVGGINITASYGVDVNVTNGPRTLWAVNCVVQYAHVEVRCKTAPGTGTGHGWMLHVDGQSSAVNWANTGYAPPVVAFFTGNGSKLAVTEGGQAVVIHGREFGPVGSTYITA